ncbi:281_t:CDS:2 [Acaulospora colombiana]|uniref:281_t:CDS:1 n=1 Tax=Acaulospora colombiana TaxID=27376 RepID=A0ACA9P017_9GLOM|nr:281_t:CDS:2 [Acaulospora colombiana]
MGTPPPVLATLRNPQYHRSESDIIMIDGNQSQKYILLNSSPSINDNNRSLGQRRVTIFTEWLAMPQHRRLDQNSEKQTGSRASTARPKSQYEFLMILEKRVRSYKLHKQPTKSSPALRNKATGSGHQIENVQLPINQAVAGQVSFHLALVRNRTFMLSTASTGDQDSALDKKHGRKSGMPWNQLSILLLLLLAEPVSATTIYPFIAQTLSHASQLVVDFKITTGEKSNIGYYVGLVVRDIAHHGIPPINHRHRNRSSS